MSAASTRFHPLLRALHWTMAALILAMLFIGIGMVSTAGPAYTLLLSLHRPVGIAIFALALLRLVVRRSTATPRLPADLPPWQAGAAHASHWLLYAAMISMPLIGWAMVSASGEPVKLTQGIVLPAILPHNLVLFGLLRQLHSVVAFLFFALILLHLAAALVHALVRQDGVFQSMAGSRQR